MNKQIMGLIAGLGLATNVFAAAPQKKFITIGADALKLFKSKTIHNTKVVEDVATLEVSEAMFDELSHMMHENFNRCGGFMVHDSEEEALATLENLKTSSFVERGLFADYSVNQTSTVLPMIEKVNASRLASVIEKLTSFHNRYYKSESGIASSIWIKDYWAGLVAGRSDAKVELIKHKGWPQPSVILTIEGSSTETIVLGGHADSISGQWGAKKKRAPGADDNASGIATLSEIIKVMIDSNYVPTKTIKFMAYAAEEVGLKGSKEIASKFKRDGVDVIGVLQLDMTNFMGSEQDIVMMTDFTNAAQNKFIGTLIDTYLPGLSWGYDKCGYGCSDHASWHRSGYPASMPFESKMKEMNKKIHTSNDTLEFSDKTGTHASKFAKLGLSFLVELDK